jgi:hypothetical protein
VLAPYKNLTLALANESDNFTGHLTQIVQQLPVLNFVEEQVIALKRVSNCVVMLKNSCGRTSHQIGTERAHHVREARSNTNLTGGRSFADDSITTAWLGAYHFCG